MKAALLPTPGNPAMLRYWLRNFETWRAAVDELWVLVNGASPAELAEDQEMIRQAGGHMVAIEDRVGHDGALLYLLQNTQAEYVVLCEDDAYVREPWEVGLAFASIADGRTDIVGSPRHEDYVDQWQEWGEYRPGDLAELRHGLWPAFLFARRADLLATSRTFGDQAWRVNQEIPGWGVVTPEACKFVGIAPDYLHLDTLFGTTFELRAMGLSVELIHRVRLYDAPAVEQWPLAPWFHVTGLSTLDQLDLPVESLPDYGPGGGLWTRRLAWWRRVGIDIEPFLARADIDRDELRRWDERFDRWAPVGVTA